MQQLSTNAINLQYNRTILLRAIQMNFSIETIEYVLLIVYSYSSKIIPPDPLQKNRLASLCFWRQEEHVFESCLRRSKNTKKNSERIDNLYDFLFDEVFFMNVDIQRKWDSNTCSLKSTIFKVKFNHQKGSRIHPKLGQMIEDLAELVLALS